MKIPELQPGEDAGFRSRGSGVRGKRIDPRPPIPDRRFADGCRLLNPNLTKTGVAMGTAAYMSPEQVRGEKLDARTDIFSFGLVLYEMATGHQALQGRDTRGGSETPLLQSWVPTPAPLQLNAEVPPKLEEIINHALEKDRDLRYQHAADLRADLEPLRQGRGAQRGLVPAAMACRGSQR